MSHETRASWLSHRLSWHRRLTKRPRAVCPTPRRLRVETLEERLALAVLTVNSLDDGLVNLNDTVVTLRDACLTVAPLGGGEPLRVPIDTITCMYLP